MKNRLIAALVFMGMTGAAFAADVDFDNGVDVSKVIEKAAAQDAPSAGQPGVERYPGHWDDGNFHDYPGPGPGHVSFTRDCHRFGFGLSEGPMVSEVAVLESVEYVQECHYVPDPPPNNGDHHGPNHGDHGQPGHGPRSVDEGQTKGMECHTVPADVFRRSVQLAMGPRKILPWESDKFQVCLEGPRAEFSTISSAYEYNVQENGQYDLRYNLTPMYKIPTSPDQGGLSLNEFSYADGKFTVKVSERWPAEYAGEKVVVKVELYKDGFLFFNSFKGDKEFTFDTANGYDMTFAESDLDASKAVATPDEPTRGAKKYYVKWRFRRVGSVSTGEFIEKGSTEKVEVR